MPKPETESLLRERIDELSTQLLMTPPGDASGKDLNAFLAALAQISCQAGDAGYEEAARVASELSAALEQVAASESSLAQLQEGLGRLQQALTGATGDPSREDPCPASPQPSASLADDPELVADFITESREHLTNIEQRVLILEQEPSNAEAINSVFRGFHTIKGLAGFLEYAPIQEIAHEVETALNLAREGTLVIRSAFVDVILEGVDYLSRSIAGIESGARCIRLPGHDRLLERIEAIMAKDPAKDPAKGQAQYQPDIPAPAAEEMAEPVVRQQGDRRRPAAESSSVRVDTAKLDYLVDMVSETVIAQSMVRHNGTLAVATDPILQRELAQLARLTGEVQKTAMAMRMVPIGQLFQRANRQVRDLSRKIGKQVELITRGEDTELDKNIAEELADPLMHMVRNSIDHGIEAPEARAATGKPPLARITLAAYHRAGQIVIEVSDDGRGLDTRKILAKAIQKGITEEGSHLTEAEIFRLVLEPGFSTAETVSDISGRGVGMDVVRRQVEKLRGRIEIQSKAGVGTTFLLKLPLTMAIIDGLVVSIGGQRYIVPLYSVTEMFRPAAESIFTVQNRQEMAMVRERVLPVLRLYKRFGLVPRTEDPCQALLIVVESEGRPFCLLVDDLIGKQEVVIKSLGAGLGKVSGIAGGAILGDGRVGLILDMSSLWDRHADS
jgi:two-component system chemotaxis sensor kinase CheA